MTEQLAPEGHDDLDAFIAGQLADPEFRAAWGRLLAARGQAVVRVDVVLDRRKVEVHAVTPDQDHALRVARELCDRYGGDQLAVSICAGVLDLSVVFAAFVSDAATGS